ncbi:MAG TPA: PTS sugar transporter subunit IIC, partial [Prevotella sp.]|nr:PTS sugar transporter subunit IIC [Prevotella sp.]
MEQVFSYIISLGASVMMPIIFTVIGLCIGMKFGKALLSGLYVGVGFVGLGVVTALLTTNFGDPLTAISKIYHLQLNVFDMGWPAAASVAYNTAVGALIIPICLGVNFLMLITKTTRTVNIDLWNYWHYAFIGAVAYFVMDKSLAWGYFAAIICYIITLVFADLTADRFQGYYKDLDGISIPQPFCQSMVPFTWCINWLLNKIPGFNKLDIDAEGLKKKFGILGEPLVLGVLVGVLIGAVAHQNVKDILFLGITMGAVMELIPRITKLFIDGLMPISEKTKKIIARKFHGKSVNIGMSPALVIGHPTTLVVTLLLIPTYL